MAFANHKFNLFVDRHVRSCRCSYCMGKCRLHYGLNIPPAWRKWNAWYVIKFWPRSYLRWTNHWLRLLKKDSLVRLLGKVL